MSNAIAAITPYGVHVWERYAREIADNGEGADARQRLMIAPGARPEPPCEYVYIETNGDPVYVGWIAPEKPNQLNLDPEAESWLAGLGWVCDALNLHVADLDWSIGEPTVAIMYPLD